MFTPRWCLQTESTLVNVFAEETFPALANFRQIFVVSHFQNCKPKYLSQKKDSRSPLRGQKHTTQPLSPPAWQAPSSSADKESFSGVLGTADKIPACLQADQNLKERKEKICKAINSWQLFAITFGEVRKSTWDLTWHSSTEVEVEWGLFSSVSVTKKKAALLPQSVFLQGICPQKEGQLDGGH